MDETRYDMVPEQPAPQKYVKKAISKAKSSSTAVHARPNVPAAISAANLGKKCTYCGSKSTPMWRRGPEGAGTLCNACGVKWKHGKIQIGDGTIMPIPAAVRTQDPNKPKSERKRKRVDGTQKRVNSKKKTEDYYQRNEFAMPVPKEGQSTTSSTASDSCSPLETFTTTPNTSPSEQKRDMSSLLSYDKESLSVYVGEDAVEAAALLTLLKRS
jgi:hypothetical protein